MTVRVLIADDHIEMARLLADQLEEHGWDCTTVDGGRAAIDAIARTRFDLVISDLRMADVDGLDVLDAAKITDADLPVMIMTAFGGIDSAIEAMRRGAYHYVVKPVRLDEIVLHARRALEQRALRRENVELRATLRGRAGELVGDSAPMRQLRALIERVAVAPSPVLIRGESGTGKELVARAIHRMGPRSDKPFLAINCTALPESLLESELFGHTRGAFTGATAARAGLFVEAAGGSLFLDEIGDMPLALQAKLLRVVQDGDVRAVGADESKRVDVRLIAATHRDLDASIGDGSFRADLFYRLDVVPISVPPLRSHPEDIPRLVAHFFAAARARNPHSHVASLSATLISALVRYGWPGNVRELENLIERLVVIGTTLELGIDDLNALAPHVTQAREKFVLPRDDMPTLRELEASYIAWVIEQCGGNKTRAAEVLGVDPSTLHRRARARAR